MLWSSIWHIVPFVATPYIWFYSWSQLLIEQQKNQIAELESELNVAQSKLQEKEAELQALKNCITLLSELPLSTVSGKVHNDCFVWLKLHLYFIHFSLLCFISKKNCISNIGYCSQIMKLRLTREPAIGTVTLWTLSHCYQLVMWKHLYILNLVLMYMSIQSTFTKLYDTSNTVTL